MSVIKAKTYTTLEGIEVDLFPNEAYHLIGILGAQTDKTSTKLYNDLSNAVSRAINEPASTIVVRNETARESYKMAGGTRKFGQPETLVDNIVEFKYSGIQRRVANPVIVANKLSGVELMRGDENTNQYKTYFLEWINK